jgi:hypothetical protein
MWAYLPVGPLERQLWEGNQGGILGRGSEEPSRESCFLSLAGHHGEASANYLLGCMVCGKVASTGDRFVADETTAQGLEKDFYLSGTLCV